jgi:hypothetical protein
VRNLAQAAGIGNRRHQARIAGVQSSTATGIAEIDKISFASEE